MPSPKGSRCACDNTLITAWVGVSALWWSWAVNSRKLPKLPPPGAGGTRLNDQGWDGLAAGRALQVGSRCTVRDGQAGSLFRGARAGAGSGGESRGSWGHWLRAGRATTPLRNASAHLTPLRPLTPIIRQQQRPPVGHPLHRLPQLSPGPCLGAEKTPHTWGSRGLVVARGKLGRKGLREKARASDRLCSARQFNTRLPLPQRPLTQA